MIWTGLVLGCAADFAPDSPLPRASAAAASHDDAELPVVVVGAGPSGLAVASQLDAPWVFEASDHLGGRIAAGQEPAVFLAGSPEQGDAGIEDDAYTAAQDWESITGAPPSEATLRYLEDNRWLRDRLVDELSLGLSEPSHCSAWDRPRCHFLEGSLVDALEADLPEDARLFLEEPVTGLLIEEGAVVGVRTAQREVRARAVVLAAGGFLGNQALLEAYAAPEGLAVEADDEGGWGDALVWAEEHGWTKRHPEAVGWHVVGMTTPGGVQELVRAPPPWILVDAEGRRHVDETATHSVGLGGAAAELHLRGVIARSDLQQLVDEQTLADSMESGLLDCAEDSAALAERLGTPVLPETVRELAWGRPEVPRAEALVLAGELCSFLPGLRASKEFGGLATDLDGRVLGPDRLPLPGLWAVGETSGMGPDLGGTHGFDGSLSAVLWSGWRTGEELAR